MAIHSAMTVSRALAKTTVAAYNDLNIYHVLDADRRLDSYAFYSYISDSIIPGGFADLVRSFQWFTKDLDRQHLAMQYPSQYDRTLAQSATGSYRSVAFRLSTT